MYKAIAVPRCSAIKLFLCNELYRRARSPLQRSTFACGTNCANPDSARRARLRSRPAPRARALTPALTPATPSNPSRQSARPRPAYHLRPHVGRTGWQWNGRAMPFELPRTIQAPLPRRYRWIRFAATRLRHRHAPFLSPAPRRLYAALAPCSRRRAGARARRLRDSHRLLSPWGFPSHACAPGGARHRPRGRAARRRLIRLAGLHRRSRPAPPPPHA